MPSQWVAVAPGKIWVGTRVWLGQVFQPDLNLLDGKGDSISPGEARPAWQGVLKATRLGPLGLWGWGNLRQAALCTQGFCIPGFSQLWMENIPEVMKFQNILKKISLPPTESGSKCTQMQ